MASTRIQVEPRDVQVGDVLPAVTAPWSSVVTEVVVSVSAVRIRSRFPNGGAGVSVHFARETLFVDREMSEADVLVRDVDEAIALRFAEGASERGVRV